MIIALDIDGTIRNFTDKLIEVYKEDYPDHEVKPIDRWFFENSFPIGKEIYSYYKNNGHRIFSTAKPFDGANDFVVRLKELGHIVVFVTTQPAGQENFTKVWLDNYICTYDGLVFTDKKYLVDYDVLLDDAPHNIEESMDNGKLAVFFNQKWNEKCMGLRVNSYDEFIELLEDNNLFGEIL